MNLKDVSKYEVTRALWGEFKSEERVQVGALRNSSI